MLIHEILVEEIQNRPRDMPVYLTNRIKALDQMLASLAQAKQLIDQGRDGHDLMRYATRTGSEDTPDHENSHDIGMLEYLDLDRAFQIERLRTDLDTYLRYLSDRQHDFLKYVMSTLADVKKYGRENFDEQTQNAFNLLRYVENGLQVYGYTPGNPEHEADPEYIAAKKLYAAYRIKAEVYKKIVPLEADVSAKMGVIVRMRNHDYSGQGAHKYRPEHEAVETLYHASTFVPEILRDGFKAVKPEERKGVGSFGSQNEISFTHDLEIARNIMRTFKELWMIAHGQLTAETILGWAKVEGIRDQIDKAWGGMTSQDMPKGRHADPAEVSKLYRYWLSFTKTRANPVLVSPWEIVETLKTRALRDIGVLACEVNLEGETQYMAGEAEFRVTADKVLSTKQVL